jgi:hypothetical protein
MKFLEAWELAEEGDILHDLNDGKKITKANAQYNYVTISISELFDHKWTIIKKKKTIIVCLFEDVVANMHYSQSFLNKKDIENYLEINKYIRLITQWEYEI